MSNAYPQQVKFNTEFSLDINKTQERAADKERAKEIRSKRKSRWTDKIITQICCCMTKDKQVANRRIYLKASETSKISIDTFCSTIIAAINVDVTVTVCYFVHVSHVSHHDHTDAIYFSQRKENADEIACSSVGRRVRLRNLKSADTVRPLLPLLMLMLRVIDEVEHRVDTDHKNLSIFQSQSQEDYERDLAEAITNSLNMEEPSTSSTQPARIPEEASYAGGETNQLCEKAKQILAVLSSVRRPQTSDVATEAALSTSASSMSLQMPTSSTVQAETDIEMRQQRSPRGAAQGIGDAEKPFDDTPAAPLQQQQRQRGESYMDTIRRNMPKAQAYITAKGLDKNGDANALIIKPGDFNIQTGQYEPTRFIRQQPSPTTNERGRITSTQ